MSDRAAVDTPSPAQPSRKYTRPRHLISVWGVVIGLVLGVAVGLAYAWEVNPVEETDTSPWQLSDEDKAHYIVAIMLNYSHDSDLNVAVNRLLALRLDGDPIQAVADVACDLATTGYVETNSGLRAVRAMMRFYRLQGKTGCADNLVDAQEPQPTNVVEVIVPTATLPPPATKTATPAGPDRPTATPVRIIVPTSPPQSDFVIVSVSTFCDATNSGIIEVFVQDENGDGIPGQEVRVRWDEGTDRFFTGLKPERGSGYADFEMEAGTGYTVELPGRSDPTSEPLAATNCTADGGERALTSYRVTFRPA